ncbi:hypothetical protein Pla123a_04330 [Posidoniimonas polymericola]|uniref:GH10 domain-containing protein n=1 Tax=Posidoniimonas polymericola TaxID=2528002 RepID=A0A5C5ZEP1_9BACT|nr:hypothetical protein [Posidoniimonas polymericola]TWT85626.1 hypothetical protein Pla123a_04330 [Posidoniimonas polymericola]
MGLMRLNVRCPERIADPDLKRVYLAGPDDLPYHGRAHLAGDMLHIERREDASGALCVPWVLDEHGVWMINTTTLMERERPYQLEVELARGIVFRVRNQLAAWQMLGLKAPEDLTNLISEATTAFSRSAVMQADPPAAVAKAIEAISLGAAASLRLADVYAEQALSVRTANGARLPTLLGVRMAAPPDPGKGLGYGEQLDPFSIISIPSGWKDVEPTEAKREWSPIDDTVKWAQENRRRVSLGPLLEFCDSRVPEWAYLFEGEGDTLASLMLGHVEACVKRYRGRVNLWNVAGRVNRSRVLGLTDEQRLQLVARAVRRVRELDPGTPVTVCFDQPWGESLASESADLAAIEFADALERADLGIAGFGVELNIGYLPNGTTPRSPLAYSQLLDNWSLRLELPLLVMLTLPSGAGPDPKAVSKVKALQASGNPDAPPFPSPDSQAEWIQSCLPVFLAKNCVQVVIYNQLRDDVPHELPHGGLVDAAGVAKPAAAALAELRGQYLA